MNRRFACRAPSGPMLDCIRPYWGLGMKTIAARSSLVLPLMIAACTSPPVKPPSDSHLTKSTVEATSAGAIPSPVRQTLAPPRPKATKGETYSVVVNNVRVHDLLFALARDAKVNVDIHPGIEGSVTLNAVDQTLPQILSRLSKQVDLRWELDGQNLAVMPDTPFLRNYRIDYVNMSRDTTGSVAVSTQITSSVPGSSGGTSGGSGGGSGGNNNSTTTIDNKSKNRFWETLVLNVKDILRETDKILPEGSSDTVVEQEASQQGAIGTPAAVGKDGARGGPTTTVPQQTSGVTTIKRTTFREAASVIAHPESGTLAIRATSRQHEKIQEFLDQVMASAKRQVLIEATIAEVELTQEYQQGINWGQLSSDPTRTGVIGRTVTRQLDNTGVAQLVIGRNSSGTSDLAIRLLETFGTVKVLSSPKISVLNNQAAVLKVVDNEVYFSVKVETNQNANNTTTNVTTTAFSVPIGFVMNVTPQIGENDTVLLNLRPSISRQIRSVADPNPELRRLNIQNLIPVIRTRELESVMRVEDGQTAVLGGLMEDTLEKEDAAVPWFHSIPLIGAFFAQKRSAAKKTELVVFIRPAVVQEASLSGDFANLRKHLPDQDFFRNNRETRFQLLPSDTAGDERK